MNPWVPFGVWIVLGLAWTAIWIWAAIRTSGPRAPYDPIYTRGGRFRKRAFTFAGVVLSIAFVVSIRWFPYPLLAEVRLGAPTVRVSVTGRMWTWVMSQHELPLGTPVEFDVTAADVNHGFGIYGPDGRMVAQVQAMPGITNRLIVKFARPGQYLVRCLEYCGIPHFAMIATFVVK